MKYIRILFMAVLLCAAAMTFASCSRECPHTYSDGVCTKCGESDPDYEEPLHTIEYKLLENGTYMLTRYQSNQDEGIVKIPEFYEGMPVTAIDKEVFKDLKREIFYIPESIKKIGEDAFLYNYDFTETQFHTNIFYEGTLESWLDIDFESEYSNPLAMSLTHLYIENGGIYSELTELTIPESTEIIKDNAFYNAAYISKITIPEGVISIGHNAFVNINASEIKLPSTLEYIGNRAFSFVKFNTVTIPASVKFLGAQIFRGCENTLDTIIFEGSSEWYDVIEVSADDKHIFDIVKDGDFATQPQGSETDMAVSERPNVYELCLRPATQNFFGYSSKVNLNN